ncbi:sugar ABC transporter substrate-binding protein [Kineosporia mesophila]|uniref:Sugar ABC transporter substrate-binding protein n=1 Tax=Kineosporia mesophila TaxID=566012 RepID=A0ABP6ZAU1_9ACTN|nr:extracellular solute-binding protein [Kineosporia mesophila]MCD5354891.1 extracellular solute-binding protein [Kineosporia mesophila]
MTGMSAVPARPDSSATGRLSRRQMNGLLVAALAGALAACGPSINGDSGSGGAAKTDLLKAPTGDPSGEIVIWDRSGDLFKVFKAAIPAFNQKYPNIKVRHEAVDIDAKLQNTLITGTDVPDGVFLDDAKVGGFSEYLWDLKDVLKPYLPDIAPQKVAVSSLGGGIYGVPYDLDPGLLFYNEKALKAAGVDVEAIETYDDLLAAARKYQEYRPGSGPIHLEQSAFLGQLQLEMFAGQLGTALAGGDGQLQLDSPAYTKILTWLDTVSKEKLGTRAEYLTPGDVGALESGDQVFYPWAIWFSYAPQQQLPKTSGDWRAMPLPAWEPGGARSGAMGGSSFVLPKAGANSGLAWLFYEFLMFDEAGYEAVWGPNDVYPQGLNTSIPSYRPAANPDKPLFKPLEALGGQDLWATATAAGLQIPAGAAIPAWWSGAVDYLGNDLQRMLDGDLTPAQVIDQAGPDIQKNLIDRS